MFRNTLTGPLSTFSSGSILGSALLLLIVTAFTGEAAVRTWINQEGTTLRAEYVTHAGEMVILRREIDQKLFEIPETMLSVDDRSYLKQHGPEIDHILALETPERSDFMRLGKLFMGGNSLALEALEQLVENLYAGIDYERDRDRAIANLQIMKAVFTPIGLAAGGGDAQAFEALMEATRRPRLRSFTADAFGQGAGKGSQDCLEVLLNPEDHGLPLASSISALQYAADENNPAAVEFLADVLLDEDKRPLWLLASDGLHEAARKGNAVARHALEVYENKELARKTLSGKEPNPAKRRSK